jgi:hypothetical protein
MGSALWPHEWQDDLREPLFTFQYERTEYGFFFFSVLMWIEILTFLVIEACCAGLLAVAIYYSVLRHQRSTLAYVISFGAFLPLCVLTPSPLLDRAGVENIFMRFCLGGIVPTTSIFRITEAAFGFTPYWAKQSLGQFALYLSSPILLQRDPKLDKFSPCSLSYLGKRLIKFLTLLFVTGLYQSLFFLLPRVFPKIGSPEGETDSEYAYYSLAEAKSPTRWSKSLYFGILFQLYLSVYGEGLMLFTSLGSGKQTQPVMENPMFESTSASDFWGRRWNLIVHNCLKSGVFKPVRYLGGGKGIAVLASFMASGLFHEWILQTISGDERVTPWATTGFFVWQAMLVSIEDMLGKNEALLTCGTSIPRPFRTACVVLCGIPLAHWFLGFYVQSKFFVVGGTSLPMILPVADTSV